MAYCLSEDFKNGEEYFINILMSLFEENSIIGTIYLNTFEELHNHTDKRLRTDSIVYLTKPIKRYAYVSDQKTIKSIKEKIIYYAVKYDIGRTIDI